LAVSTDAPADNLEFARKYRFNFPLLCDVDREVSLAYGACAFKQAYYANRVTYIIDEMGTISKVFGRVDPKTHAEEILALL